jgi:hypothetical protein
MSPYYFELSPNQSSNYTICKYCKQDLKEFHTTLLFIDNKNVELHISSDTGTSYSFGSNADYEQTYIQCGTYLNIAFSSPEPSLGFRLQYKILPPTCHCSKKCLILEISGGVGAVGLVLFLFIIYKIYPRIKKHRPSIISPKTTTTTIFNISDISETCSSFNFANSCMKELTKNENVNKLIFQNGEVYDFYETDLEELNILDSKFGLKNIQNLLAKPDLKKFLL